MSIPSLIEAVQGKEIHIIDQFITDIIMCERSIADNIKECYQQLGFVFDSKIDYLDWILYLIQLLRVKQKLQYLYLIQTQTDELLFFQLPTDVMKSIIKIL